MAEALMIAGTVVSTVGSLVTGEAEAQAYKASGKVEKELAEYRAKQLAQNAGQARASAQHKAEEERRQAGLVRSRAKAIGASGGAIQGTDVENILAGLTAEGEYNAKSALYEGEEAARGMEAQADSERYSGALAKSMSAYQAKSARRSSYFEAAGNLLKGSTSFYEQYWPEASTDAVKQTSIGSPTRFGVAYG